MKWLPLSSLSKKERTSHLSRGGRQRETTRTLLATYWDQVPSHALSCSLATMSGRVHQQRADGYEAGTRHESGFFSLYGCPSTLQEAQMPQDEGQALADPQHSCPQPASIGGRNTWAPLPREPGFRGSCLLASSWVLIGQGAQTLTPLATERARSGLRLIAIRFRRQARLSAAGVGVWGRWTMDSGAFFSRKAEEGCTDHMAPGQTMRKRPGIPPGRGEGILAGWVDGIVKVGAGMKRLKVTLPSPPLLHPYSSSELNSVIQC